MEYSIKSIPEEQMRYSTSGDYMVDDKGVVNIQVCKQINPDYEFLIALHEFYEEYATRKNGIKEQDILAFDKSVSDEIDEQAEHKDSPYFKEHFQAETLERIAAAFLGVDWRAYNEEINYKK